MDNHLHLLLRLNLARAKSWSAEEIVWRWLLLCPLKDRFGKLIVVTEVWIKSRALEPAWVEERRNRLADLGWFTKSLKEPISRRANHENKHTDFFSDGRYKSIAILDETSLLTTLAYIDLNPVAAGIAATPETSSYTSIKARVDHCAAQG